MTTESKVRIQLTAEQKEELDGSLQIIKDLFTAFLINITKDEKKSLMKLGNKSLGFVKQNLMYTEQNPEFVPFYLNVDELKLDVQTWEELAFYQAKLQEVQSLVSDSIAICGNEAYRQSLSYYNNVKQGTKDNVQGAKVIYDELKKHYVHHRKKSDADEE